MGLRRGRCVQSLIQCVCRDVKGCWPAWVGSVVTAPRNAFAIQSKSRFSDDEIWSGEKNKEDKIGIL